ncbi:MAG TPA: hypothetical protein VEC12_12755 [Bacteroidia bacterium]|nr:hypothetical protein [Bacteroidia bacterium]
MSTIKLNFINRSNDVNNSDIVIFQKNVSDAFGETAVAWRVIKNCGQGMNHPFSFPEDVTISAGDAYGNYTPQLPAQNGQSFQLIQTSSGEQLTAAGQASSYAEIELGNSLSRGAISANIYRDHKLVAIHTGIAPGQKAVFAFKPTIWIGVVSQMEEGAIMNQAIVSELNTEISLLGIVSADIVLTGGGSGANALPFQFTLQNMNYWGAQSGMMSASTSDAEGQQPTASSL